MEYVVTTIFVTRYHLNTLYEYGNVVESKRAQHCSGKKNYQKVKGSYRNLSEVIASLSHTLTSIAAVALRFSLLVFFYVPIMGFASVLNVDNVHILAPFFF